jgi:three-Cys-motif partner protein
MWFNSLLGTTPMAKKAIILDPTDGLLVSEVGKWAPKKHARVQRYIEIASAVRAGFLPPPSWHAGASYIELFSGPGRSVIRRTKQFIDGSPVIAYKAALESGVPFTEMHLNDFDSAKSAGLPQNFSSSAKLTGQRVFRQ